MSTPAAERIQGSVLRRRDTPRFIAAGMRLVWAAGRRGFLTVAVMDLVQGLGVFVVIIQIQKIISSLVNANKGGSWSGLAEAIGIFIAANAAIMVAEGITGNRRNMLGQRASIYVCGQILKVACLAELDDFDDSRFHDRLQRAAASALTRPALLVASLVTMGQTAVMLLALWVGLIILQPWIALAVVFVVIPIWLGGTKSGAQQFDFVRRTTSTDRDRFYLFSLLTTREPAKEIRAFNLADYLSSRWQTSMEERLRLYTETLHRRFRSSLISSIGSNAILAVAAALLIGLNRWGVLSLAATATVAGVLFVFSQQLFAFVGSTNDFFESAPLVGDLDEFLSLEPMLRKQKSGQPFKAGFEKIELDGVSFTYQGSVRRALDQVSLTIPAGKVVALVGENGSGKTTLAKLLAGLYVPQEGSIRIDGSELSGFDSNSWRESVAVLFQDFIRYALSAEDNIRLGRVGTDSEAEVRAAARAAGADGFLGSLPDGYETILSPQFAHGQDLSLGQWQRVALARAFFRDAPLVILDEPSASLDARAERALFENVRELYENRTVLLISHRFSTVRTADYIAVLGNGKIVEQGSHAELMAMGGLYSELFSIQASAFLEPAAEDAPEDAFSAS
ncbi:MAG TPA: ABC transporter ATP-binding protein [Streptosporangiaceae bacterium]|nr:ABC transporter ATP-binding protein [Streptosporangiaceae bacterium]